MLSRGLRLRDIGTLVLSWDEFRDLIEHMKPDGDSAYYRARYPKTWWVTPELQFEAAQLLALQGANWQRSGGQGDRPKLFDFPKEAAAVVDPDAMPVGDVRAELRRRQAAARSRAAE